MIRLKDLQNRVYRGKECVRFEYAILINEQYVYARFNKEAGESALPNQWTMQIVFGRTRDKDSEVYNFTYAIPKHNAPLELVAAVGLKYFQLHIKEEVQMKSNLDFNLGEITDGVVG